MPRPVSITRSIHKNIALREDLCIRLEKELYSVVDGRIPMNAQRDFFNQLLQGYFDDIDRKKKTVAEHRDVVKSKQTMSFVGEGESR